MSQNDDHIGQEDEDAATANRAKPSQLHYSPHVNTQSMLVP